MQGYCDHCKVVLCDNRCANCLEANYCSRECQVANWSSHKAHCQLSKRLTALLHEITQKMLGDIHIVYANNSLNTKQPVSLMTKVYMTAEDFMYSKGSGELLNIVVDKTQNVINLGNAGDAGSVDGVSNDRVNKGGENNSNDNTENNAKQMNFKFTFNFKDMKKTITIMCPPNVENIAKRHPGATFMPVKL